MSRPCGLQVRKVCAASDAAGVALTAVELTAAAGIACEKSNSIKVCRRAVEYGLMSASEHVRPATFKARAGWQERADEIGRRQVKRKPSARPIVKPAPKVAAPVAAPVVEIKADPAPLPPEVTPKKRPHFSDGIYPMPAVEKVPARCAFVFDLADHA